MPAQPVPASPACGATIPRDPENGHFALCRALAAKVLDAESFVEAVSRLGSTLRIWAGFVKNYRPGEDLDESITGQNHSFMKVYPPQPRAQAEGRA